MQEQLLHFIWHRQLFDAADLTCTQGKQIEIVHTGFPNQDQGPDFLQARIRIDQQLWAGHVEIHIRSSSWFLHGHHQDTHYNAVVLHVVWVEDQPAITAENVRMHCLELGSRVDPLMIRRYELLMNNVGWVACASSLSSVDDLVKISWLERVLAERLEGKTNYIHQVFERCGRDWEQTFFVMLCRHLGAPANSEAMENLAYKVPLQVLRRHGDRPDQIEAILFGVAGMLERSANEAYPTHLVKEFDFLKKKYGLQVIPALQWKFLRMRPYHFPTVRIAQLAVLVSRTKHFISVLLEEPHIEGWVRFFAVAPANEYWESHYHFKAASALSSKKISRETACSLVINVVAPFLFYYGRMQGPPVLKERALQLLGEIPAEKNAVIKGWQKAGWSAMDAGQSQALLQLRKQYCEPKRCLHCAVGLQLMKEGC